MKNFFNRLMAFLAGAQSHASPSTDWRGHPLGERPATALSAEDARYTTLRLPSLPEAPRAGLRKKLPDPM
jgi:hypothetical protein